MWALKSMSPQRTWKVREKGVVGMEGSLVSEHSVSPGWTSFAVRAQELRVPPPSSPASPLRGSGSALRRGGPRSRGATAAQRDSDSGSRGAIAALRDPGKRSRRATAAPRDPGTKSHWATAALRDLELESRWAAAAPRDPRRGSGRAAMAPRDFTSELGRAEAALRSEEPCERRAAATYSGSRTASRSPGTSNRG